ncbi:MAG: thioredoxin 1 [Roseivirga sp.]|jgi:thioredoxin 1
MKEKFDTLIAKETVVLIDFYADWCGPCQAMAPVLEQVASKFEGKVKIIKVDIDKNQPLAQKFGIRSIPTMMLFKDGKELWKKGGMMTNAELTRLLERSC